jgi:uncharacterized protein (TIGR00369 family)
MSGRELLEAIIDGRVPPPPFAGLIGAELVRVGDGEAVFRSTPGESADNALGMVQGGILCGLFDSAAGCAVQTRLAAGARFSTIELKVSFLRPVYAGTELEVHGRSLRVGTGVAFAEAHAYDAGGELLGHATTSLALQRA